MPAPASFARDATMASDAPEDDGTEAESLAEVETPRHPFTPPADADYSTTGVPVVDLVLGKDRTPRWSDAGYASIDFGGAACPASTTASRTRAGLRPSRSASSAPPSATTTARG